ncbi:pilus assembly protein [Alphaproteobacteria bacterium KMM 3653]|uniref:Pilus assembly protein n=1 Tax=Harenicola maris TaxID=2841044 RepID=A0AAP2G4Y3_9RHOB|nr:pilus assembly protein [Harenicola maris]
MKQPTDRHGQTQPETPKGIAARWRAFQDFRQDEAGGLIIFSLFMMVCMLLAIGISVDVARFEVSRTKLQNTVDRAVLAAADLDQTLDPQTVVEDYFDKAGLSSYLVGVNVDQGLNYRTVTANTQAGTQNLFLNMVGIQDFTTQTSGVAEERVSNVEISLVVDISGSMGSNSKMANLRTAAKDFVDTVIRDEAEDLISLSLIPYTAQVNAGKAIFDQLQQTSTPNHDYSYCIDFDTADFSSTGISYTKKYEQMQHFEWSSSYSRPITNPGCPMQDYEEIVPLSQDKVALKATIDQYRARANTAIHLGMKWGTILLDPTSNIMVSNLAAAGEIDDAFSARPAAWDDDETLKVVVLMTDGENVSTYRIEDWAYNSNSEYAHWNDIALIRYLYSYVSSRNRSAYYYQKYSSTQADSMLSSVCSAAKDAGILVFSIGFEVSNHAAEVMEDCASSSAHFFRVEGVEISEAFNAIARQINQLRLLN